MEEIGREGMKVGENEGEGGREEGCREVFEFESRHIGVNLLRVRSVRMPERSVEFVS